MDFLLVWSEVQTVMEVVLHILLTKLLDKPSRIDVKCFESCCDEMSLAADFVAMRN